jgi:phosphomannomutase/phosphoglucomutase
MWRSGKGGTKKPPQQGSSLAAFWLSAFIGMTVLIAFGAGAWVFSEHDRQQRLARERLDLRASALRQHVSQTLAFYQRLLQGVMQDPDVRRSLVAKDADEMTRQEAGLTALLPDALRVRLLLPRHRDADLDAKYPLSFAALELLRAAESADAPLALEIHQLKSAESRVVVGVTAVRSAEGVLLGSVHVIFAVEPILRWFNDVGKVQGRIELQQRVDGRDVTLFNLPGTQPMPAPPDVKKPLRGSQLSVAQWYAPATALPFALLQQALLAVAVLMMPCGLLLWFQYQRLRKALDADQAVLMQLFDDAVAGRKPHGLKFKLSDSAYILELLKQRLKGVDGSRLRAAAPSATTASDASPPAPETDLEQTGNALVDDGAIKVSAQIFRAEDIQGRVDDNITDAVMHELGRAIGSQAYEQGVQAVIVARDCRDSGKALSDALIEGLNAAGQDALDLGAVPLPVLYFATHFLGSSTGAMVGAKDSPEPYNGLQLVVGGELVTGKGLQALRERIQQGALLDGSGSFSSQDLLPDYIERIVEDVSLVRSLKLVVDCGSGCAALVAPALYRALGCEVVELFCDVDNTYPGHRPEPSQPENLAALCRAVVSHQADLGLAFDSDGDRLVLVDSQGHVIWPDRIMMLLAADVLSRHPGGDVIYDVKCSRALASQILQYGGRPVMWKSSAAALRDKLRDSGALLAGAWSGHIIFRERWFGFEDGIYSGARLLEVLSLESRSSAEIFAELPIFVSTPELFLDVLEGEQFQLLQQALDRSELLGGAKLTTLDGLRAEFEDGWGLMCAAASRPSLLFRFEADSEEALARVQGLYRSLLADIAPQLQPPF